MAKRPTTDATAAEPPANTPNAREALGRVFDDFVEQVERLRAKGEINGKISLIASAPGGVRHLVSKGFKIAGA